MVILEWNKRKRNGKKSGFNTETEFLNTERLKSGIKKVSDIDLSVPFRVLVC
jgi:hypothetical protein